MEEGEEVVAPAYECVQRLSASLPAPLTLAFAGPAAASTYEDIQELESTQLVRDMLNTPQEYWGHCQRYAGSTIMNIAFNKRANSPKEPAITRVRPALSFTGRTELTFSPSRCALSTST